MVRGKIARRHWSTSCAFMCAHKAVFLQDLHTDSECSPSPFSVICVELNDRLKGAVAKPKPLVIHPFLPELEGAKTASLTKCRQRF